MPAVPRETEAGSSALRPLSLPSRRLGRTSDQVYAILISAIRDLRLLPGTVLSENSLAMQLGVSRTPVREALARLADAFLVEVTPQVGTRVAPISMVEVRQAQWVRECLETRAFELACAAPDLDVSRLNHAVRDQDAARRTGDIDGFFHSDEQLHAELFRQAGQPGAWDVIVRSKVHLDRLRRLSVPSSSAVGSLIAEHRKLRDALAARDVAAGVALVQRHARHVLELQPALQRAYPDYFAEE